LRGPKAIRFFEEVLKAPIEQGALRRVADGWAWSHTQDVDVPRGVRSLVRQRVGRLQPRAQELLRIASVVGHEFALDVLLRIADQPEADLLDHLDAAFQA
jgi:predicted ATPase